MLGSLFQPFLHKITTYACLIFFLDGSPELKIIFFNAKQRGSRK